MKKCSRCKQNKSISEFGKGRRAWCRKCTYVYQKEWRKKNPRKAAKYNRMGHLRRTYGLSLEDYDEMLAKQDNRCAICGSENPGDNTKHFHVDHRHSTGEVRGLLCGICNRGMGCFEDDIERLHAAIEYLERFESTEEHIQMSIFYELSA